MRWRKTCIKRLFEKCKQNSQFRSVSNSVLMTAELTSSEQHFTKRMLHQRNKQFLNTILLKRTTHPNIRAKSDQTTLQKNCPAESGDNGTEHCWMPMKERQKLEKHSWPLAEQNRPQKMFFDSVVAKELFASSDQPYHYRVHTRGGLCQPF